MKVRRILKVTYQLEFLLNNNLVMQSVINTQICLCSVEIQALKWSISICLYFSS